jgi:UDP-N-acetylmuramoyl-tripeptide--D-alanyl-D-alanine ligase
LVAVADADAALALLRARVVPGDAVLVKASRSIGLERLAAALVEEHGGASSSEAVGPQGGASSSEAVGPQGGASSSEAVGGGS